VDVTEVGKLQRGSQTGEGKAFQIQIGRQVYTSDSKTRNKT